MLLHVDLAERMFTVGSEFPGEAQHLRGILVGVGDVEVSVRPEDKPPQLTQIEVVREVCVSSAFPSGLPSSAKTWMLFHARERASPESPLP